MYTEEIYQCTADTDSLQVGIITWDAMFINVSADGFSRHLWDVRFVDVSHLSYVRPTLCCHANGH